MASFQHADGSDILIIPGEDTIHFFAVVKNAIAAEYSADGSLIFLVTDGITSAWVDSSDALPVDSPRSYEFNKLTDAGNEDDGGVVVNIGSKKRSVDPDKQE